jgi:protein involved in plasmid replication-relaxation
VQLGIRRSSANDSLHYQGCVMSRRRRVTEAYVADLAHELAPRELALVHDLDRLRLASVKQIERLHFTGDKPKANTRQAQRALTRLTELRVLVRLQRRVGGVRAGSRGSVYALDVAGQRLASVCGPAGGVRVRRPWTPGRAFVAHQLAVTELYVRLIEAAGLDQLNVLDFDAEPACWRTFTGLGGARTVLKPDAFVRLVLGEFEDAYFIEVDRATHSGPSVARKLTVYRRYWQTGREQNRWGGVFPKVLIVVPSEARKVTLVGVASEQPAESWPLFQIVHYDEALEIFTGGPS